MKLVDDGVGVTDLIAHRECPRRMSYGMRRHGPGGTQTDRRTPEAGSPATAYGSAIHHVIAAVEGGAGDDDAIAGAYRRWGHLLEPGDRDRLREDLNIYRARDFPGTRTVACEDELRVPLTRRDGAIVYFRFRLDRLYERLDAPGHFIHVDYKSSAHPKTQADVDADIQMWAYNWAIHEFFPECVALEQFYDQLRFGQPSTRKTPAQRQQIREWLVAEAIAVLEDDDVQADGLLDYRYNEWCPWCPIMESCGVVKDLTDFALTRIAALGKDLDWARASQYTDELPRVKIARGVLKRFDESVRDMVKSMPAERREGLGYETRERNASVFTADAARSIHDGIGDDDFYRTVKITKAGLSSVLADDEATLGWALSLADETVGSTIVVPRREAA